jgi:CTP synthase (UTP-ammonia lyase)
MEKSRRMKPAINIGIIGDFDSSKVSYPAANEAIRHAADHLGIKANITWLPTPSLLTEDALKKLEQYDGLWASSGSLYQNLEGALNGIRQAREKNIPFIGT